MLKTFKNLFWNQNADDLETWFVALVSQLLPNDDIGCPWSILQQGQMVPFVFVAVDFQETIEARDN